MSYQITETTLDLMTTIAMRDSEIVELNKRIAELEQERDECAVKHDLKIPEWVRVSASCLLNKKGGE